MGLRDKLSKAIVSRAAKKAERASTSESNTSKSESRSLLKQILSRDKNSSDISDEEESDHENESVEGTEFSKAKDKNFGMKKYVDADKPGTWNVLIRAIEARDVDSGALRVRAICDGRQKTTRAVTHIAPKWKQNLLFTMKNETLEKLSAKIVGLKVTRATRFGETVVGEFSCYFSAIVHASDRAIIAKWVALTLPNDNDDQDHVVYENCGFLKLSICIYRIDETPPQLVDDDGTEEVWSGAQIVDYTLKIRIFRLCRISEHIVNAVNQLKSKKKLQFFISVQCGNQKTDTSFEPLLDEEENDAEVRFEQELYLPIQWPTVLSKISLALYMKRGRKKRCIGQASIPLRSIYEPGESGFMPTFGPTFINFFGLETLLKLKWLREKKTVDEEEGSKYLARLLVAVDCVEHMGESTARSFLDHSSLRQATLFENYHEKYVLCCSLQSCNMINPLFASDSIQFFASIATYGSTGPEKRENSSSSLGAMPNPDGCKYFVMPWGNCLPTMEIKGLFENVDARMERTNALMKVEELLRPSSFQNQLDNNLQMVRKKTISKLLAEITGVRYELSYRHDDVIEKVIRLLTRMRQTIFELAQDVQSSIPSIVVKMMSHSKMIGYVKIPVHEVFCAEYDALSGEWCGRVRAIPLRWPASFDRKHRREEFPAVLHVRMWFGSERRERLLKWKQSIEPAELKSFVEIFQIQKRSLVTKQWKAAEKAYTDEDGEDCKDVLGGVAGLTFVGNWVLKNTHDTWMSQICGRPTVEDKALEVERREPNNAWKFYKYTGYFGNEIPIQQMEKAPKGWEYSSKWVLDKHRNNGDKYGWVYSTTGVFWGDHDAVDREMRPEHKYRRRFITRVRRATTYSKDNEKLETYQDSLGDVNWEHAPRRNTAFHDLEQPSDTIRRRRFMIEVEQDKDANEDDLTRHRPMQRLYEAHLLTTRWQLRCYIMWAKDLLPIVKNSSRAFVRIFFAYQAQQTLVVENSQNPIWNETIIFESVLIPGGMREISTHPPVVHVEVRGERTNDTEVHLGRFKASPTVITSPADSRAVPVWSPLTFHKGHTRGSVLACFEMFQHEKGKDNLPVAPEKKVNYQSRLEIPKEMRPHFAKFSVQFLCWGVRNLSKYQLLSVRRPFVEVTIGDVEMQLEPLKNVAKDPNFPEPMITFPEVSLPVALELSPPLVVSLYDSRAFRRRPLIGVCLISDFNKYIRSSTSRKDKQKAVSWEEFDRYLDLEDEKLVDTNFIPTLRQEGMPHLDWWSKYYSSLGQFQRAPGYEESGMEYLQVLKSALEDVKGYNNFGDFLDTFSFVKSTRGDFDDPEEKQKTGELKARLLITPIDGKESQDVVDPPGVEFVGPVNCLVRVYVIEANGLVTNRKSGVCDPYITVRCGKQQVNLKKNYRADTTDPLFGERIDLNVTIPVEKDLKISIMDKRRLLADEEIGTTTIDLENRLLTKWRATTGLSKQYTIQGEMPWRDQLTPLATLKRYCTKMLLPAPYTLKRKSSVNGAEDEQGISLLGVQFWYSDVLNSLEREEMEMVQHQRESAGKEPNADVDEKTDTSAKRTLKNAEKEDENKFANWDLVEVERTLGKKSKDTGTKDSLKELRNQNRRQILGSQLQTVALYVLQQMNLVPEHVETRFLHAPMSGTAQCGKLRLFVDILPLELGVIPAPLNIAPRQPERYQLRIAVQNVAGAIPVKRSFGEPVGDLYVKAFVNGMSKGDKTDVHYRSKFLIDWQMELFRSLDGFGEFNWRFLLELDFNPWERKLVSYQKTRFFRKAREELVDPLVIVQLWDKNKMRKDNMLGEIVLDLTNFLEGIANPEDVGIFAKKDRKVRCKCCSRRCCLIRCCIFCKETRCLCGIRKSKKKPFPRPPKYVEPEEGMEHLSLFEAQSVKGWWPMLTSTAPNSDEAAAKKKDDDFSEGQQFVMGLVEMELSLVTLEEAIADPVGRKRKEPNHSPYLAKPHRSKWNSFWFTSRIRPCISWFWHRFGLQLLLLILLVLFIFVAVYALVYNWPLIVMHIVG